MAHEPVEAIIFDYGKVLSLPPTSAQWNRLASIFGVDQPKFQEQYWGLRDGYDRDEYNGTEYWRRIGSLNDKQLTDSEVKQLIQWDNDQWTNENHQMLKIAFAQQENGKPIAILSNMQNEMLEFMRKKFKWLEDFDLQIYSCEVGIVKPSREIYELCCRKLACNPRNTLFLDDKKPNIDGAKAAGLQTILFAGDHKAVERHLEG